MPTVNSKPAAKVDDNQTESDQQAATSDKPATSDVVLAPLVSVKDEAGRIQYLYRGAPLPKGTPAAELARLREMDLIGPDDGTAVPGLAASQ